MTAAPKEKPLEGYKEIAAYLGRCERTVRYWAKDRRKGLPVWRLEGRMVAYPSALELWKQTHMVHASIPRE